MVESSKPVAITSSPLLPNTLRILVLVEASNKSSKLSFRDTLQLEGADLTLDLTKISDRRIQDIEVIDMTGSGDNSLKLNLDDLLDASTSTNILKVLGNSGDKVIATGFDDSTIDKTVNGITYDVYTHSILVKSRVKSAPSNCRVSIPPPPSTRARLPMPVCLLAPIFLKYWAIVVTK
jgi:hypothetical protein